MPELLFEIGCEELPADAIGGAMQGLREAAESHLKAARLAYSGLQVWSTPRRLTLAISELATSQEAAHERLLGPAWRVAFGSDGKPTPAAEGFAAKQGVPVSKLVKVTTPKGDYVAVERRLKAEKTARLLPGILAELIRAIPFPKSMRWGHHAESFGRPVHWLLALYDGRIVRLEFAGIHSGRKTYGHRFLAPKGIVVGSIAEYVEKLQNAFVIVDPTTRRQEMLSQVRQTASRLGGRPLEDEALIDEVVNLVEWPVALAGSIEARFLDIPREVIVTSMKDHQRYFSVEREDGSLLPHFITVSNMRVPNPAVVVAGNQRVLAARLSDAMFFVREDLKVPLISRLEALNGIVYQAKLGTVYEKVERFTALASRINAVINQVPPDKLVRAAHLAKADLTTGMVGEFPELQGVIGAEYARRQNEPPEVAAAVFEHYLPRGAEDCLPQGDLGALVGLADKLDTIVGCFGVGLVPTGTADPYALRRAALGILRILLDKKYPLRLESMVNEALALLIQKLTRPQAEVRQDVLQFLRGRFENWARSQGVLPDEVEAVLARGFGDVVDAYARMLALHGFRRDPAFEALATAFKRAANILQKELGAAAPASLRPELLVEVAERELAARIDALQGEIAQLFEQRNYEEALRIVSSLRDPVDHFFAEVLVVAPDPALKANRLALLARLRSLFDSFADFTRLGGSATVGAA